jgi:hypothetical protein
LANSNRNKEKEKKDSTGVIMGYHTGIATNSG